MAFEFFDDPPVWAGMLPEFEEEEPEFAAARGSEEDEEEVVAGSPEEIDSEKKGIEATYVMFKEEPGFDQMYDQAQDWLERPGGMLDTFNIFPVDIE